MAHPDHEKNRAAWNQMARIHFDHPEYRMDEFMAGWNSLKQVERDVLGDVTGLSLLHLQCQFGMDTLSWARLGARVTGVDISDDSIEYARSFKDRAGFPEARFIRSDVLDLIGVIDDKFDIVFMSHGTICWLSSIHKLMEVVAHHLKPGGRFFIVDAHPMFHVFDPFYKEHGITYFGRETMRLIDDTDYADRSAVIKGEQVEFVHTTSDIINATADAGLVVKRFDEYNKGYYPVYEEWVREGDYWHPPEGKPDFPLMFSLLAVKP